MRLAPVVFLAMVLVATGGCATGGGAGQAYELVIAGGRVMDPETGLDAVRDIGVTGGKIRAVSQRPLVGAAIIDARGLVVAPGFIDLHAHGQDAANYAMRAADGVTTALELEVGTANVDAWYAARAGKALINHGVSVGHIHVRMAVLGDPPAFLPQRSWSKLLTGLKDHFGEDASLPADQAAEIEGFLLERAGDAGNKPNRWVRRIAKDQTPLRITELPALVRMRLS